MIGSKSINHILASLFWQVCLQDVTLIVLYMYVGLKDQQQCKMNHSVEASW